MIYSVVAFPVTLSDP